VVSVPDSGSEEHGFESQSRRCRVAVLGKLFTPIVPRSTQPCTPSGSLNRVPASAGVKAAGNTVWSHMVISRSGVVKFHKLLYSTFTFLFYLFTCRFTVRVVKDLISHAWSIRHRAKCAKTSRPSSWHRGWLIWPRAWALLTATKTQLTSNYWRHRMDKWTTASRTQRYIKINDHRPFSTSATAYFRSEKRASLRLSAINQPLSLIQVDKRNLNSSLSTYSVYYNKWVSCAITDTI